jgi:flavin reductase (DIM6/NTAB) family NADH-FMN oxidoreductase RutF
MPVLRPDETDPYQLLTSVVVPRPIAWVSTLDADGVGNLAPHSFFSVACAHPPIVSLTSVGAKDTLANVLATGEFTVSVATEALQEQVNATSAPYDASVDEAAALGVRMAPSTTVAPPRVADSPAALECRLHSTHQLGDSTLVLGEVVVFWVDDDAMVDGLPAIERLRPVSRLGRNQWGRPPEVFALDRPRRAPR